jgi:8-oxo-dGTP diphosphatase
VNPSTAGRGRRSSGEATKYEYSAGGVLQDGTQLLMVKVENLEGAQLWTFPKGHVEKGEKAPGTALREVEEETGYRCEIIKPLERVQYYFKRGEDLVKKTVTWYLMKPIQKTGQPDPEEIMETRWVSFEEAKNLVKYKSDKKILGRLKG